jgi:hypothetical protein
MALMTSIHFVVMILNWAGDIELIWRADVSYDLEEM